MVHQNREDEKNPSGFFEVEEEKILKEIFEPCGKSKT
jgi:hypothetical protein